MNARVRIALSGAVLMLAVGCGGGGGDDGGGATGNAALIEANETCPSRSESYVEHYTCLGTALFAVIDAEGPEAGFAAMRALVAYDPIATTACHQAAHWAGRQVRERGKIAELIAVEDGTCDFGITHGAVENLHSIVDDGAFYEAANLVCGSVPTGIIRYNCAHGLGHALAIRSRGSILELMRACGALAAADQAGCVTAAAMAYTSERASLADDVAVEIAPIPDEQLGSLCETVRGVAADTCWQQIGGMFLGEIEQYPAWGVATCTRAIEIGYGARCANGYGQALYFQQANAGDLSEASMVATFNAATDACLTGPVLVDCIVGVSGAAASYWSAERPDFSGYPDLCGRYPEPVQTACREPELQWRGNEASLQR